MNGQRFFYLKQNGRIFGPFPAAHILKLFRSDALHEEDEISVDKVNWKNALQFFNVPDETVLPFELPEKQKHQTEQNFSSAEIKVAPADIAPFVRRDYVLMRHLYIIFAVVMLSAIVFSAGIYFARGMHRTKAFAAVETEEVESEKIFKFEPPEPQKKIDIAAEEDDGIPEKVNDAPKKVSSAFILTVFINMN